MLRGTVVGLVAGLTLGMATATLAQAPGVAHVYILSWSGYTVWIDGHFFPLRSSDCDPVFRSPDVCIIHLSPGSHKFATRGDHYWDGTATLEPRQTYMLVSPGDWSWSLGIYHVIPGAPEFSASLSDADPDGVMYVGPGWLKGPWPPQWKHDSVVARWKPDSDRFGSFASLAECSEAISRYGLYGEHCAMFTEQPH